MSKDVAADSVMQVFFNAVPNQSLHVQIERISSAVGVELGTTDGWRITSDALHPNSGVSLNFRVDAALRERLQAALERLDCAALYVDCHVDNDEIRSLWPDSASPPPTPPPTPPKPKAKVFARAPVERRKRRYDAFELMDASLRRNRVANTK